MIQVGKVVSNGKAAFCYAESVSVAPGQTQTLCRFYAPRTTEMFGLSVGFGLGALADWGLGAKFIVLVGGREVISFTDEISDIKRMAFIPVEVKGGESVQIDYYNGTAAASVAAAVARIESV